MAAGETTAAPRRIDLDPGAGVLVLPEPERRRLSAETRAFTLVRPGGLEPLAFGLDGPGVEAIVCSTDDPGRRLARCELRGALVPGARYSLFVDGGRSVFDAE